MNADLLRALAAQSGIELRPVIVRCAWSHRHWRVPLFLTDAWRTLARMAERREIDGVLFSSLVTGALALPLRRQLARAGIPSALIAYGHDVTMPVSVWQRAVPHILRAVDVVVPISSATALACIERGLPPERAVVVPLGVDASRFPPSTDRCATRRELATRHGATLPHAALLLCSVGRQIPRKGFAWFVDAVMPRLPADVHYWLAGDGPECSRIEQAIERHGLHDRVRLLGRITDEEVAQLYGAADLFVMPNVPVAGDMEGFGLVLLEAGVSGLPSIASRLEGIADVITEGENGHLLPSGDAAAFGSRIMLYHDDRAALAEFRDRARVHTTNTFGWEATVQRYLAAFTVVQSGSKYRGNRSSRQS